MATRKDPTTTRKRTPSLSDETLKLALEAVTARAKSLLADRNGRATTATSALEDDQSAFAEIGKLYTAQQEIERAINRRKGEGGE